MDDTIPCRDELTLKDIEFDLLDEVELKAIQRSGQHLLDRISSPESYYQSIWPPLQVGSETTPHLTLVPLDRLGAVQGYSGNQVMVGYFVDRLHQQAIFPSLPLVVKISEPDSPGKLKEEKKNAKTIEPYIYDRHCFAIPFHFDPAEEGSPYSVLWSPFASDRSIWDSNQTSRLSLGISDLSNLLQGEVRDSRNSYDVKDVIRNVYDLLKPLH